MPGKHRRRQSPAAACRISRTWPGEGLTFARRQESRIGADVDTARHHSVLPLARYPPLSASQGCLALSNWHLQNREFCSASHATPLGERFSDRLRTCADLHHRHSPGRFRHAFGATCRLASAKSRAPTACEVPGTGTRQARASHRLGATGRSRCIDRRRLSRSRRPPARSIVMPPTTNSPAHGFPRAWATSLGVRRTSAPLFVVPFTST